MDSNNLDVQWRKERRSMEQVAREKRQRMELLTREAPKDFAVTDTQPNDIQTKQQATASKNTKNLRNKKERVEPEDTVVPADTTETHERPTQQEQQQQAQETTPMTYSNATTKNDVYHGKLTLISDIHGLTDFKPEQFCHDLAAKQPRAW